MSDETAVRHLSIGEVLDLLQSEFPDVTISKIRFLESRGLVEPQRTASGYRQFSGPDVDRLRWILRQQRDHFLPLKVIKQMLDEGLEHPPGTPGGGQPSLFDAEGDEAQETPPPSRTHPTVAGPGAAPPKPPRRRPAREVPAPTDGSAAPRDGRPLATPADVVAALQEDPRPAPPETAPAATPPHPAGGDGASPLRPPASGPRVVAAELLAATGLSAEQLSELESFGLVEPFEVAGEKEYPPDAVAIAGLAARYLAMGVGPRHLGQLRRKAGQEADLILQLTLPLSKKRTATARAEARDRAGELAGMGAELHLLLLRQLLGPTFRD